jgi:hypothetical protein
MKLAYFSKIAIFTSIGCAVGCGDKLVKSHEIKSLDRSQQLPAQSSEAISQEPVQEEIVVESAETAPVEPVAEVVLGPAPNMSEIPGQSTIRDQALAPIPFLLSRGGDLATGRAVFTVDVSDPTIVDPKAVLIACEPIADTPGSCTGLVTLAPLPNAFGETSISIHVDNGQQIVTQSFTLFVTLNPIAKDDLFLGSANRPMIINIASTILANDTVLEPALLSIVEFKTPEKGGTITKNDNGTITYLSAKDFIGEDSIQYTITDGYHGTSTGKMKLTMDVFIDNFSRVDAPLVGSGWVESEVGGGLTSVRAGALNFASDNTASNPIIVNTFPLRNAGKLEWTFDFNFTRSLEASWSLSMQLGKIGAGTAVNLIWGGGTAGVNTFTAVNTLGTISMAVLTERTVINGKTPIKVIVDLDTNTYDLIVGGVSYPAIPFDSDTDIDSITFKTDFLDSTKFTTQDIDNIRIRPLP